MVVWSGSLCASSDKYIIYRTWCTVHSSCTSALSIQHVQLPHHYRVPGLTFRQYSAFQLFQLQFSSTTVLVTDALVSTVHHHYQTKPLPLSPNFICVLEVTVSHQNRATPISLVIRFNQFWSGPKSLFCVTSSSSVNDISKIFNVLLQFSFSSPCLHSFFSFRFLC